eukprot:6491768-Amphidinium_carterae.1
MNVSNRTSSATLQFRFRIRPNLAAGRNNSEHYLARLSHLTQLSDCRAPLQREAASLPPTSKATKSSRICKHKRIGELTDHRSTTSNYIFQSCLATHLH